MKHLLNALVVLWQISSTGYAMKPVPPEELKLKVGKFVIKSMPKNVGGADKTSVFEAGVFRDNLLWEVDTYIGHKKLEVSNDGKIFVVFGNVYFGTTVRDDSDSIILSVYEKGTAPREFTYRQVTSHDILADIEKHKLSVLGGGWVTIDSILKFKEVIWEKRQILFDFENSPVTVTY